MYRLQIVRTLETWPDLMTHWDDLCQRAPVHFPMHQAGALELLANYFADGQRVSIILVWQADRLVAGLPLITRRRAVLAPTGKTLANEWAPRGCILVDPAADTMACADLIIEGMRKLGLLFGQLDWLHLDHPLVQVLIRRWSESGIGCWVKPRMLVGRIDVPKSWDDYTAGWSRNRRKKLGQLDRQLQQRGAVELVELDGADEKLADAGLAQALAIEQASWKGISQSSIQSHDSARSFVEAWSRYHRRLGNWRLYFLTVDGQPIAFDLGTIIQRVYTSYKISFAPDWSHFSPGQLLMCRQLQHFSAVGSVDWIDCVGELNEAVSRWSDSAFTVGKIVLSTGGWLGNQAVTWMAGLQAARARLHSNR